MPAIIQTKSTDSDSSNVSTLEVILDTTPVEDGFLMAMLCTNFSPGTVTPPTGWTLVYTYTTGPYCYLYRKIASASESSTVTFSWTGSRRATLIAREYGGVDTTTPIDVSVNAGGSSSPHSTGTTATIGADNTIAEAWFGITNTSDWTAGRSWTNSYTESAVQEEAGSAPAIYIARNESVTPGGTTETSMSTSSGGGTIWGALVVFKTGPLTEGVLSVVNRTSTTIELSATDSSGGSGSYTYQLHRSETGGFTPGVGTQVSGATSLTHTDTGLTDATTYYYVMEYNDGITSVYSNEISITTSAYPLVVITDHDNNTSGTWTRMAPCSVMMRCEGSYIGTGDWNNSKVVWNWGDSSGEYNEHRGFIGGHFYDVEPVSNTDYTVTCTITNSAGLSHSSTRTVRITPNTRRIVFVDPDDGSASPTDPTDSEDPYDTIASAVTGEGETDLEVRCTAGKVHAWTATFGGSGADNIMIRSTVKGTKFQATAGIGPLVQGGERVGVRDLQCNTGGLGSQAKILDPRAAIGHECWAVDVLSNDSDVALCFTGSTSRDTFLMNCTTNGHNQGGDCFFGGFGLVALNVKSLDYQGGERPFRGTGWWTTFVQCKGEYNASAGKTAFTRSGGQWCYITESEFSIEAGATGGSSIAMQIGHTSAGYEAGPVYTIVERTLLSVDDSLVGSETALVLGGTNRNVDYCTIRNCVIKDNFVSIGGAASLYPTTLTNFFFNTIINEEAIQIYLNSYWNDISIYGNLSLEYVSGDEVVIASELSDAIANQALTLSNNVWPVADNDDDIRIDNGVTRLSWSEFNALSSGTGNLSKNITYDNLTYRPNNLTDTDLLKTSLPEMGAVLEDYYGNPRNGETWVAGAVGVIPPEVEETDLPTIYVKGTGVSGGLASITFIANLVRFDASSPYRNLEEAKSYLTAAGLERTIQLLDGSNVRIKHNEYIEIKGESAQYVKSTYATGADAILYEVDTSGFTVVYIP